MIHRGSRGVPTSGRACARGSAPRRPAKGAAVRLRAAPAPVRSPMSPARARRRRLEFSRVQARAGAPIHRAKDVPLRDRGGVGSHRPPYILPWRDRLLARRRGLVETRAQRRTNLSCRDLPRRADVSRALAFGRARLPLPRAFTASSRSICSIVGRQPSRSFGSFSTSWPPAQRRRPGDLEEQVELCNDPLHDFAGRSRTFRPRTAFERPRRQRVRQRQWQFLQQLLPG